MKQLTPLQVKARSVAALGLNPEQCSLTSIETIAAAFRRAAGFLCPCAASSLVQSVMAPMRGLVPEFDTVKVLVEETLDQLIGHGDLFEYRDLSSSNATAVVLYSAPCGFVVRSSGAVILVGISADQLSALPPDLEGRIEAVGCTRLLRPLPQEKLREELLQIGLIEIPYARWAKAPLTQSSSDLVTQRYHQLRATSLPGEIPGLLILEPATPVRFYRKRWTAPEGRSGRFVARRSQAYGAPLWCYVELQDGQPQHLIDFPAADSRWRGCDEAWHLQMALDATNGTPQVFSLKKNLPDRQDMLIYSPIPMWAQRRWDSIGERIEATNCLLAFRFPDTEIEEECRFATSSLWLAASVEGD